MRRQGTNRTEGTLFTPPDTEDKDLTRYESSLNGAARGVMKDADTTDFVNGIKQAYPEKNAKRLGPMIQFVNHRRVAKRRCRAITSARGADKRWLYYKLKSFRAGIEAGISYLKRCFGLSRCTWKGLANFKAYVWSSIFTHNLVVLSRRLAA